MEDTMNAPIYRQLLLDPGEIDQMNSLQGMRGRFWQDDCPLFNEHRRRNKHLMQSPAVILIGRPCVAGIEGISPSIEGLCAEGCHDTPVNHVMIKLTKDEFPAELHPYVDERRPREFDITRLMEMVAAH
jgi:hypothetical protein